MDTQTARSGSGPSVTSEVRDIPQQQREATLIPSTYDAEANTVEIVWTTGARRRAYDWYSDQPYEEELVVAPESVDMTRFESGVVQVLDGHRVYGGVSAILGIAQRGWIENGEGRALIKLSQRDELAGVVKDIQAGIIRSISFGYSVERYEITRAIDRTDGVNMPLYRAIEWTPQEISFVTVPADPGAKTRSAQASPEAGAAQYVSQRGGMPCVFVRAGVPTTQERTMADTVNTAQGDAAASPTGASASQTAHQTANQRSDSNAAIQPADIADLCQRHGVAHLAADLIRSGSTLDQARSSVLEELARRDAASGGHRNVRVETVRDETQTRMAGVEEALMHRIDARSKLGDNGRQYRGMSLIEIGRDVLESSGVSTRGMDRMTLATRILTFRSGNGSLTTSDFSAVLANVASKRLRGVYEEHPGSYTQWARRAPNAPDFKSMSVVQLSGMPDLLQTNEAGEFKYSSLSDGAETYALLTYGRIVTLSRQALINDDLRAFDRLVSGFGSSASRLENRLVYAQLTGNPVMSDGTALFDAAHGNLGTGAGSALGFPSLSAGRAAMRKQKGLQGEPLNLAPAYLIVPSDLEQTAYQYTSSQFVPAKPSDVNEFRAGGRSALEPIVEPLLDGFNTKSWFLAASNSQVDTVEYCYLDGAEGPVIESEIGFEVDGVSFKCREDFATKVIDHRGLYRGDGA